MEVENSNTTNAPDWDAFLERQASGEFQQSSMWARAKAGEGWKAERHLLRESGEIRGGFQMLWKATQIGRIGYVSRGPVTMDGGSAAHRATLSSALTESTRELDLRALIVQCAAGEEPMDAKLTDRAFLPNRLQRIITATWITPLEGGIDAVTDRMRRETRAKLRKAIRQGVTIEEAKRQDLGIFFGLMVKTCQRQAVAPNPASRNGLESLWDAFHPTGQLRLGLARYKGRPVSGALSLRFGTRLSIWKKGSDPDFLHLHPMEPLYLDALEWGCRTGAQYCDHGSLKQETAEALLAGNPLTDAMKGSRDFYNMRFGGYPALLPEARVWFHNPFLRGLYRFGACSALGSRLLRNRYRC